MDTNPKEGLSVSNRSLVLTERQLQVIALVAGGYSNRDLAKTLGIGERAAKYHLTNIYRKLGAVNRLELVLLAIDQRIIGAETKRSSVRGIDGP